jgi:hypothetical protein
MTKALDDQTEALKNLLWSDEPIPKSVGGAGNSAWFILGAGGGRGGGGVVLLTNEERDRLMREARTCTQPELEPSCPDCGLPHPSRNPYCLCRPKDPPHNGGRKE